MTIKELLQKDCVTCQEMKDLERAADKAGLSYYNMMENAGSCAAKEIVAFYNANFADNLSTPLSQASALIFCGKGNNGGDGFVVARRLKELEVHVNVILVEGEPNTPDSMKNYELIQHMDIPITNISDNEKLADICTNPNIVVDAIYGTGFSGSLRENAIKCITAINRLYSGGAFVVALDLPSGLPGDMDENAPVNDAVKANATMTFHAKKQIHSNHAAKNHCGQIIVCDIGIDSVL